MIEAVTNIPYPNWLNPGDNTWQLVAATLVGVMSLPGIAVLYGGLVQRKWVVNTLLMVFAGFSITVVVWVLWAYSMAFGPQAHLGADGSFWSGLIGHPKPILSGVSEQSQAVSGTNTLVPFHFPTSSLAYFQLMFAAITPLLFLGSVLGRFKFKAWLVFVPLWINFVYAVNAALIWGGGFFAQKGAVDFAGGYVIHLSAGVTGFVAAAIVGPRLLRDRTHALPNNLMMVAVGAGILWLGWNGFNGGAPYYAGADTSAAVLNTNIATAVAAVKAGAVDYLPKPADADAIESALLVDGRPLPSPPDNPMSADRVRWEHIQRVFEQCDRNVSETARRLKMHRRTLQRILNKHAPRG